MDFLRLARAEARPLSRTLEATNFQKFPVNIRSGEKWAQSASTSADLGGPILLWRRQLTGCAPKKNDIVLPREVPSR
jgi:hypothetical protein